MTLRHRIRFYQQLAVLARAGVSLRGSLERLQGRLDGPEIRILSQRINAGDRMGEAFQAARFSKFETNLVAAGEKGAQLDRVFEHLAEYWTHQLQMRQAMLTPLVYPFCVLHLSIIVGAVVQAVWTGSTSHAIAGAVVTLATAYFIIFVLYMLIKASWSSEGAQRFWQMVPLIGGTLSAAYAYRWITAMRIEFNAGISLANSVADAWRASGYSGAERLAEEGQQGLREGKQLSQLMQGWKKLPRDWIDFIETGELSGKLEEAFKNLETEAARNWNLAQQRLSDWLPKITYFIVLLIVAVQVISVASQAIKAPFDYIDKALNPPK